MGLNLENHGANPSCCLFWMWGPHCRCRHWEIIVFIRMQWMWCCVSPKISERASPIIFPVVFRRRFKNPSLTIAYGASGRWHWMGGSKSRLTLGAGTGPLQAGLILHLCKRQYSLFSALPTEVPRSISWFSLWAWCKPAPGTSLGYSLHSGKAKEFSGVFCVVLVFFIVYWPRHVHGLSLVLH